MGSGTSCLRGYHLYYGRCVKNGVPTTPKRQISTPLGPSYEDLIMMFFLICVVIGIWLCYLRFRIVHRNIVQGKVDEDYSTL
ncbi:hypothetical protein PSPO01_16204 [Paraphaeosphaeria sporulosa]